MKSGRALSIPEARAFYDRFGARQDSQAFYEDRALDVLVRHADFESATSVFEFGCGTGRFARRLLAEVLPETARYVGVDVSSTMVRLARERLRPWANRAEVLPSDGTLPVSFADRHHDRFLSTYVLDLMSDDDIRAVTARAASVLAPTGLLCLVGLTHGRGWASGLVTGLWSLLHRIRPALVGGCRPIDLLAYLPKDRWAIRHREVVTAWGLGSEVVVAAPLPRGSA